MNNKYSNLKFAFMSFSLSFFVFSLALLLLMSYGAPGKAVQAAVSIPVAEETYRPSKDDALAVLFMGMATRDSLPGLYILAKLDPQRSAVTILILPPETAVQNNGGTEALAEVYRYGGADYTRDTLAKTLGISIDRFARMDYAAFILAADTIGSMEADLENDIIIDAGGAQLNMRAGKQLLDGQRLLALMRAYQSSRELEDKYGLIGILCMEMTNQRIDIALSTAYERVFERIINLIDSDISYADFHSRMEATAWLAKQPSPAVLLTPSGTWENGLYILNDTFLAEVAEMMG